MLGLIHGLEGVLLAMPLSSSGDSRLRGFQRSILVRLGVVVVERGDLSHCSRPDEKDLVEGLITCDERGVEDLLPVGFQLNSDGRGKDEGDTFLRHSFDLLPTVDVLRHVGNDARVKTEITIGNVHLPLQ